MNFRTYIYIGIALLFLTDVYSQSKPEASKEKDTTETFYYIIEGESMAKDIIDLDEVVLMERLRFDSEADRRAYLILRRKTRKVYPFAKLAADRLATMNERLEKIEKKSDRKRYTKRVQKFVEEELSDTLKKFTRSEGQILVKLIHRQTGRTTYDLIKDLRTGWRAFWYNTTANVFDISLKEVYLPYYVREDYLIEDILERSFQEDILERQKPAYPIDILNLANHWKNTNIKN